MKRGGRRGRGRGRRDRVRAANGRDVRPGFYRVLPGEEIRPGHRRSRTVLTLRHEEGGTGPRWPTIVGAALRCLGWVMRGVQMARLIEGGAGGGDHRDSTSLRARQRQIGCSWCGVLTICRLGQRLRRHCGPFGWAIIGGLPCRDRRPREAFLNGWGDGRGRKGLPGAVPVDGRDHAGWMDDFRFRRRGHLVRRCHVIRCFRAAGHRDCGALRGSRRLYRGLFNAEARGLSHLRRTGCACRRLGNRPRVRHDPVRDCRFGTNGRQRGLPQGGHGMWQLPRALGAWPAFGHRAWTASRNIRRGQQRRNRQRRGGRRGGVA